jgi:hypothetical protein
MAPVTIKTTGIANSVFALALVLLALLVVVIGTVVRFFSSSPH